MEIENNPHNHNGEDFKIYYPWRSSSNKTLNLNSSNSIPYHIYNLYFIGDYYYINS